MNPISMKNRLLIGIVSTIVMLFVFVFPSELTDVWEWAGLQGVIIAIIITVTTIQIAALSNIFKPIAWIEGMPLLLAIILIWASLFVVDGTLQLAPGSYRRFEPSFLIISVPMFMLIISAVLGGTMLLAPAQDRKNRLLAREVALRTKNQILARVSRRAAVAGLVSGVGLFLSLDLIVRTSMVSSLNACVQEQFQVNWRSSYLKDPWKVPYTWSKSFVEGFERRGNWWVSPEQTYLGPEVWSEFVAEVSINGIPVTRLSNEARSPIFLNPAAINYAEAYWGGFSFDRFVRELASTCAGKVPPPLFPIASGWQYGSEGVHDSINDIDGYVAPVESVAP